MSDTIKVEMEMPVPPEGFRYKKNADGKGVCRPPKAGEWFLNTLGEAEKAVRHFMCNSYPILERVPKPGEIVWKVFSAPIVYDETRFSPEFVFPTSNDIEKFFSEASALADRIRAESEGSNG